MSLMVRVLRQILRLHRKMPPAMRQLGDRYAMKEFRDHAKVRDAAVLQQFEAAWIAYLDEMRRQVGVDPAAVGAELDPGLVDKMSEEQRLKLVNLRFSTTKGS